jgi:outer membrane protein assembly factor BamB
MQFMNLRFFSIGILTLVMLGFADIATAGDWYRWRGPNGNGISDETGWLAKWSDDGPKRLWKARVGTGFSSITISDGRAYTMGNSGRGRGKEKDTIFCFNANTGKTLWSHNYEAKLDPKYYDGGTSATPTIDGNHLYTLSKDGLLICFAAVDGKVKWQKDVAKSVKAKRPSWGFASSPVVYKDSLLVNVGTYGTCVDKNTGDIIWQTGSDASGYSSMVKYVREGQQEVVLFAGEEVVALDPKTGKKRWSYPWETKYGVNSADPILLGEMVFISSGYNRGCALLKVSSGKATKIWENKNMCNHFNACVLIEGHLYGFSGNTGRGTLRCLEMATGKMKWEEKSFGGFGALQAIGQKLLIISNQGELVLAETNPEEFTEISRAQVTGPKCWTTPVLSNGLVYCRNSRGDLVCLDLRAK